MSGAAALVAQRLRSAKDLTNEQLTQEFYNCSAALLAECEGDDPQLSLLALLLYRLTDLFREVDGRSLDASVREATDEDFEILLSLAGDRAPEAPEPEAEAAAEPEAAT